MLRLTSKCTQENLAKRFIFFQTSTVFFPRLLIPIFREAVVQRCSVKKVLLKMSQNTQESTCARVSFLIKLQPSGLKLWNRCFPVNFVKFLRTPFFIEHLRWLLLHVVFKDQPGYYIGENDIIGVLRSFYFSL